MTNGVSKNFKYTKDCIKHPAIKVGDFTYGNPAIDIFMPGAKINIGKFCSISNAATLRITADHRIDWLSNYPFRVINNGQEEYDSIEYWDALPCKGNINIGNDVWIGHGATIMGGVTIGDGAVIGAYAVVAKDVAPYSVVIGNPIREIRKRFSDDIIKKMLILKWWDWPVDKIQQYGPLLCSANIDELWEFYISEIATTPHENLPPEIINQLSTFCWDESRTFNI